MRLGQFLSVNWSLCLFCLRSSVIINYLNLINHVKPTTSVCSSHSLPDWGVGVSSLVCMCHGSLYCASMSACQHARSVPACQRVIPEVSELPWTFPEVPDVMKAMTWCHCARWLKTHKTVLMAQFYLKWWYLYSFASHVMAYWLWVLSKSVCSLFRLSV